MYEISIYKWKLIISDSDFVKSNDIRELQRLQTILGGFVWRLYNV